jgi:hypothetical protein
MWLWLSGSRRFVQVEVDYVAIGSNPVDHRAFYFRWCFFFLVWVSVTTLVKILPDREDV